MRLLMQGFGFFLNTRMQDGEFFVRRILRQPFEQAGSGAVLGCGWKFGSWA